MILTWTASWSENNILDTSAFILLPVRNSFLHIHGQEELYPDELVPLQPVRNLVKYC